MSIGVVKVLDSFFDAYQRLRVKILYKGAIKDGKGDIRTPIEASPFGIDSRPIKGKVGIYARAGGYGKYYLLGYLNTKRMAETGEIRIFATDDDGVEKSFTWHKKDGTIVMNSEEDNAVVHSKMAIEINEIKTTLNNLVTAYNGHTHPYAPGRGSLVPSGPTPSQATPSTANIDNAKNTRIKTNS